MKEFSVECRKIKIEEYQELRATTNWSSFPDSIIEKALEKDLFSVLIYHHQQLVAMGRVIGDGVLYFYIQDLIVHPDYQKQGLGTLLMKHIDSYLNHHAPDKAFIGLMAAENVQVFYEKIGYQVRPSSKPGMYRQIKKS